MRPVLPKRGPGWALALLSGLLQVLPFPLAGPVPLWRTHLCWIALTPLLWALTRDEIGAARRPVWRAALLGYLAGVVWYLGNCYWIYQTMHLYGGLAEPVAAGILVLFALYLGLYQALFGACVGLCAGSRLGRQGALLLSPFLWVACELARARITGFPWDLLGVSQVDNPLLTRLAPFTGAYGLSFVIAAVNALWLVRIAVRERRWTRGALTAAGVLLVVIYAVLAFRVRPSAGSRSAERGTATLLQENLEVGAAARGPRETEADLLRQFASLSLQPSAMLLDGMPERAGTGVVRREREPRNDGVDVSTGPSGSDDPRTLHTLAERSDVILWPESPAPFEETNAEFRAGVSDLARAAAAPVLVGDTGLERAEAAHAGSDVLLYNSASYVDGDGRFRGRYDKMHLVPFGEYVPFKRLFFFAGHLLDEAGTFQPGEHRRAFGPFGVFICYESIFGDEIREFPALGATVLVNLSNDGWYGDTSAPWQHLNMVRMRAIENHRWVLRATNTGVTAAIDPQGNVTAAAPRHVRTAIRVLFAYEHDLTFYSRHGDVFAWACALISAAALAAGVYVRPRRAQASRQRGPLD